MRDKTGFEPRASLSDTSLSREERDAQRSVVSEK